MASGTCMTCGTNFTRPQIHYDRAYCSQPCYQATRGQNYKPWRQGQRIARQVVSRYFDLQPEHVVHHEDSDNTNNALSNLKVFASQSDHMKYHHGREVPILFDGSKVSQ